MTYRRLTAFLVLAGALAAPPLRAGTVPLYQPAPAWVVPAALPTSAAA